jgi:hypothetical protein
MDPVRLSILGMPVGIGLADELASAQIRHAVRLLDFLPKLFHLIPLTKTRRGA